MNSTNVQPITEAAIVVNNVLPAVKGGRCFNGAHRDRGQVVHAVNTKDGKEPNGYWGDKSFCGAEPGLRSYGWSQTDKEINCPKCLKKLSVINGR